MNNPIPLCATDSPEWAFRAVEMINELQDRYDALREAVANTLIIYDRMASALKDHTVARAEVDRLLEVL